MTPSPRFPIVFAVAATISIAACDDNPTTPRPGEPRRPSMVVVSGSGQIGEVGTELSAPLVVRVLDSLDAPAAGVVVRFASTATATRDSSATDALGEASVRWVLDTYAGTQDITVQASVYGERPNGGVSTTFHLVATPGAPASLTFFGGDGAVAAPNTSVDTVIVESHDRYGNLTYDAPVVWTVVAGGGTVHAVDSQIDDYGSARAVWVMGPTEGANELEVSVEGLTRRAKATASAVLRAKQVVLGENHSCALTESGVAYCWGLGSSGQLGVGRIVDGVTSLPRRVSGGLTFTSLVAGSEHTCGIVSNGSAYCWGNGRTGQIGNGYIGLEPQPTRVSGLSFVALAAGQRHTCGLSSAGLIFCWGDNSLGQIGITNDRPIGPQGNRLAPELMLINGVTAFRSIIAGSNSTCAIATSGFAYCWGANALRELGGDYPGRCTTIGTQMFYDGTTPVGCSGEAVRISSVPFSSLAAHRSGWCGVTTSGALTCWGNAVDVFLVTGTPVLATWIYGTDACGLEESGRVTCWGAWRQPSSPPIVRPFGDQVELSRIAGGLLHGCGITTDGRDAVYCWGDNTSGQLGDATVASRPEAKPVLSPRVE